MLNEVGGCADLVWHFCFERAIASENDNRLEAPSWKPEYRLECFDVQVVLSQRILKPYLVSIDGLRPLGLIFSTENPAAYILRFDHENTKRTDVDVVDLGGSAVDRYSNVGELSINLRVQPLLDQAFDPAFSHRALESRALQKDEDGDNDQHRQEPQQGLEHCYEVRRR